MTVTNAFALRKQNDQPTRTYIATLLSVLFIFTLSVSCQSDDDLLEPEPEPLNLIGLIEGGHQKVYSDSVINVSYGLFNRNGEPTTSFQQGEEIILSFWLENKSAERFLLFDFLSTPFMGVIRQDGNTRVTDFGHPYGDFCTPRAFYTFDPNDYWKIDVPWISDMGQSIACPSISRNALPTGEYITAFVHSFRLRFEDESEHRTDEVDLSIPFTVN